MFKSLKVIASSLCVGFLSSSVPALAKSSPVPVEKRDGVYEFVSCNYLPDDAGPVTLLLHLRVANKGKTVRLETPYTTDFMTELDVGVDNVSALGRHTLFLHVGGKVSGSFETSPNGIATQVSLFLASNEVEISYLDTNNPDSLPKIKTYSLNNCKINNTDLLYKLNF